MVTERFVQKLLAPIRRRINGAITRAVVSGVVEGLQRQNLQLKMHADESVDDIERFQNYGCSSFPPVGSEAILAAIGGNLGNLVAVAVEDKKFVQRVKLAMFSSIIWKVTKYASPKTAR